jgi:hypothetical protein
MQKKNVTNTAHNRNNHTGAFSQGKHQTSEQNRKADA